MRYNRRKNRVMAGTFNPNWMADPRYDDMIIFTCNGKDHKRIHDALYDYLYSGNMSGKFGSIGSGYGEVDVWLTDKTTVDDVEDLIQFMQENGAYITEYYLKKLRKRFGSVDASARMPRRRSIRATSGSRTCGRRRAIKASVADVDYEYMRFTRDLATDLDNEHPYFELSSRGVIPDDDVVASYEIIPFCNGHAGHDFDDCLVIDVASNGEITAYCKGNGDIVAQGDSFDAISSNCYNWLKETLIMMYEDMYEDMYGEY